MTSIEQAWQEADTDNAFNDAMPPDGDYQATLDGFQPVKDGTLLKTALRLTTGGEWVGQEVVAFHSLTDPDRIQWTKKHLAACGMDVENVGYENILDACKGLLDTPVDVTVKTTERDGKRYRNVYVNRPLGPVEDFNGDGPASVGDEGGDDGIEF